MASKKSVRKPARKAATKAAKARPAARRPKRVAKSAPSPMARKIQPGLITHTEMASANPAATQAWCAKVLGWKFEEPVPSPTGPYRMWRFANGSGGGIRSNNPPEVPGSIPYCEVANIKATFAKALAAGATGMLAPEQIPGGMGWIAIVAAPGGVAVGFWGMK